MSCVVPLLEGWSGGVCLPGQRHQPLCLERLVEVEEAEFIDVSKGLRNHQGLDWVTVRKRHLSGHTGLNLGVAALGTEGVHTLDSELRVVESVSDDCLPGTRVMSGAQ